MATTIVLKCNKKVQKIQAPSSFEELVSVIKQKFYIKDSKPKIAFKDEDDDKYDIKDEESYQDFLSTNDDLKKIKGYVSAKKFFDPPKEDEDSSEDDSEDEKSKPKQRPKKKDKEKEKEKEKEVPKDLEKKTQINEISTSNNDKEEKLLLRISALEQCNLELKKTIDGLTTSLNAFILQVEKHNNGIDSIIQSQTNIINSIKSSMIDNKEMFQNIKQNLNEVTKMVANKSEMLSNSLPQIDNPTYLLPQNNQISDKPPYSTVQNAQSTSKMFTNPQISSYDSMEKIYVNNNNANNPTPKPNSIINQQNPIDDNSLGISKLPPSSSKLFGNSNLSNLSSLKGEYNSQYITEIKISKEQYDKKEFYFNLIITNNGSLPWPANTIFKMGRANQKDILIEDIIVSENIVKIGDTIHIQPKATVISNNDMTKFDFQGYLFNKELGVIGKVTTFNIIVIEEIFTIELKEKQPQKTEDEDPKELSQEQIDKMYKKLCEIYQADELFNEGDIINAIMQSQGVLETAKDILFS